MTVFLCLLDMVPNFVESEFEQTDKELSVSLTFSKKKFVVGDIIKILVAQSYSKKRPATMD